MVDGGKIMHLHVTSNEFDTGVSFSADETQYTYGDSVTISITGKGERFAGFKFGVQVEFTGNDGEAMGYFHNLSTALTATPVGPVISPGPPPLLTHPPCNCSYTYVLFLQRSDHCCVWYPPPPWVDGGSLPQSYLS